MNRSFYKTLVALMWLALPLSAAEYWLAWDKLPPRMAVHFDANWHANGYASREGAVKLGLGIMAVALVVFTVGLLIAYALKSGGAWPLLVVFYIALGFFCYGNHSIIEFNLNRQPAHSELVGPNSPAMSDSRVRDAARVSVPGFVAAHS
jgi:hypothetical protein